jgi:ABC-type Fe3+ transport system permease subunit
MHIFLFNSAIIALSSTVCSVAIGTFAAYALARFKFVDAMTWPSGSSQTGCCHQWRCSSPCS